MQYKAVNLCDYCFEPVSPGQICPKCGLTEGNYHIDVGLLPPGTNLLGKYIIGRVLGRGGFGATYLAFSSERERSVAIKEYFPAGMAYRGKGEEKIALVSMDKQDVFQKGAKRFFDEAKTISKFNNNKNVVTVYEFFYANDTVYYSMEYLEGIDLKGYAAKKGGRIPEGEAVKIMFQVAEALMAIHSTGTLHRDISPDNVFICSDGSVKLIDFGAAKQVVGEQSQSLSVILKQGFAPVEQYQKDGKQGMWTDIYALGATIYYALTGKVPDDAMSRLEDPELKALNSIGISDEFKKVINKCMRIKLNERYQSSIELIDALKPFEAKENVILGGYVQDIYNNEAGNNSTLNYVNPVQFQAGSQGADINAAAGYNPYASQNPSQYMQSAYPQSAYPQSQVGQSQYFNSQYIAPQPEAKDDNSGIMKIVIIGGGVVVAVIIIVVILIVVLSGQNQPPVMPPPGNMPPPPPGMQQGMPPGMPPGNMQPPPMDAAQ